MLSLGTSMNRVRLRSSVDKGSDSDSADDEVSDHESLCFSFTGEAETDDLRNNKIDAMLRSLDSDLVSLDNIKLLEFSKILTDDATKTIRKRFCDGKHVNRTMCLQSLRIVENTKMTSKSADNLSLFVNYQLSSLIDLDLSKNPRLFNEESLKLLLESLHRSDCRIQRLNLSHNSIGRRGNAVDHISKLLINNQSIQHLDLSYNCLTHKHMNTKGGLFKNRTLLKIDLSNNNLRDAGVRIIMHAINTIEGSVSILEELHLSSNSIGCNGVSSIFNVLRHSRNLFLKKLDLSYNMIGTAGSDHLRQTLYFNHILKEVNLSGNQICGTGNTVDGLQLITEGLSRTEHSTLVRLDLAMAMVKDSGALVIASMVRNNGTLETLNLSQNSIQSDGMNAILDAVPHNTTLKELWLHNNKIKDENNLVSYVCDMSLCNLEVLTYANNNFNAEQLENIESAFQFHNNMKTWLGTFLENIKANSVRAIRLLSSEVKFGDRELQKIAKQFVRHPVEITTVRLDGGNVTNIGMSHFAKNVLCSGHERLRVIYLYCYNLTKLRCNGMQSIARCLSMPRCSLRGLTLCNCNIGPEGAAEIARCLEDNISLTLLCLQSNHISDLGAKKIFAAILDPPHPKLTFLNLSNNRLTDTALEGLGRFDRLVDVLLNKNEISDRGVLDICKAVMDTTSIRYLNLKDNPQITPRGIQTLQLYLPHPFALDSE